MAGSQPSVTGSPPSGGLGVLLTGGPSNAAGWADAAADFAGFEAAGCSALWLADHLFWGEPMPEPLVLAGVAAAATSRCTVGTGVLQLPLRRPAAVAKAAATLQLLSGGRFVLGVGSGEHRAEYERTGADFGRRGADLDAGIDELRRCWHDRGGVYEQRPVPPPIPVWVGGRSPAATRRAARTADGWMPIFVTPEQFAAASKAVDEGLAVAGRARGDVARAAVVIVSPTGSGRTRADALAWMANLWRTAPDRLDRYLVTGPPDRCAAELAAFRDAGAGHVAVLVADDDPRAPFADLAAAFGATSRP